MNYYIATSLGNVATFRKVKDLLAEWGHSISYDWSGHGSVQNETIERQEEICEAEIQGVANAEAVIVILPGGRGTHTELGMAIAWGKPVILYDPDGYLEGKGPRKRICIFYRADRVAIVRDWKALERAIGFSGKIVSW